MTPRLRGVYAPVLTPFTAALEPDAKRFVAHCRWLLDRGASLAVFGTNSEAASLSVAERLALTDALLQAGVPAAALMPGTGACALTDAVTLTRHAVAAGAPAVLMLPPFYFKGVTEDGVFAYYAEVIERVGDERLAVVLYHFPQMTQVPITPSLVERLLRRYPRAIAGAKDSSGDWANTEALIRRFGETGFAVFPGSESFLSRALAIGGAGCISATANVHPGGLRAVLDHWDTPDGPALQARADAVRAVFQSRPMIAAMKRVLADAAGHRDWAVVRPPLTAMAEPAAAELRRDLDGLGFAIAGYPAG